METAGLVGVCGEPRSIVEFNANNSILTFESMAIADSIKLIPIGNWLISLYLIFAELQKKNIYIKQLLQHIERTWDVFTTSLFFSSIANANNRTEWSNTHFLNFEQQSV